MSRRRFGRTTVGIAVAVVLALALGGTRVSCASKPPALRGGVRAGDNAGAATAPARPAAQAGQVVRIRDGDSIVVLDGGAQLEVRLHGVDAPELGQAYGRRAKSFAGDLAFGRRVELKPRGKDSYGRTLAEVILPDGRSLNRELVSAGLAWWYRQYTDDADLAAREQEARAARRGLWADAAPVPPWEWREAHPRQ